MIVDEQEKSPPYPMASDSRSRSVISEMQEIRQAEAQVRPFVGAVDGATSAAGVYRVALRRLGERFDGFENSLPGLKKLFEVSRGVPPAIAMDQAQTEALEQRFPHINRLHTGGRVR